MASAPFATHIKRPLRIENLIGRDELTQSLRDVSGRCGVADLDGQWVGVPSVQHKFCAALSSFAEGRVSCEGCLRQHMKEAQNDPAPPSFLCQTSINAPIAPVRVRGAVVGYVRGPQFRTAPFMEDHSVSIDRLAQSLFSSEQAEGLRTAARELPVFAVEEQRAVDREVRITAALLSERSLSAFQMEILSATTMRLAEARETAEASRLSLDAVEALLGGVSIGIYLLNEDGRFHPFASRREDAAVAAVSHELGQGHVGWVAQERRPLLAPDLDDLDVNTPTFLWRDPQNPAKSALTVPVVSVQEHSQAVIQVSSVERRAFHESDIEPLRLLGTSLFVAVARIERATHPPVSTSGILDLINHPVGTGADLLALRRNLYEILTREALAVAKGVRSCIRTYDERAQELRFTATAGNGWNEEIKKRVYRIDENSAATYAVKMGGPFHIKDAESEKYYKKVFPGVRSLFSIPLYLRRRIVAVLTVDAETKRAFSPRRKAALQDLVAQACSVLEHLALVEDRWLYELEGSLTNQTNVRELCDGSMEHIRRLFGVRGCSIFLKYPSTEVLTLQASTALDATGPRIPTYAMGEGLTGWVGKHHKILRVRNTADREELHAIAKDLAWAQKWPEHLDYEEVRGHWAFLAAPLLVRGQLIGVLRLVIKEDASEFQYSEEFLIERVANRLALSIQNLWLTEANQRRLEQLRLSVELGDKLSGTLDLKKICEVILEEGCKITACNAGHIRKFDRGERNLKLVKAVGPDQGALLPVRGLGEGISGKAAESREAFFIPDVLIDERCADVLKEDRAKQRPSALASVKSAVYSPLFVQGELVGTLTMHSSRPVTFGDEERAVFRDLANRSAVALKAALMFDDIENELHAKIDALARIREMGIGFAQTLKLDDLLGRVLDGALQESRVEAGTIRILDPARKKWLLSAAKDESDKIGDTLLSKMTANLDFKEDFLGKAFRSETAIYIPDAKADDDFQTFIRTAERTPFHQALLESVRSLLVVPIRLEKRCLGLIFLLCKRQQYLLPDTIEYMEVLASYAAVAIDNAHFHEEQATALRLAQPLAVLGTIMGGFLHEMRSSAHRLSTTLKVARHPKIRSENLQARLAEMEEEIERLSTVCADLAVFSRTDRPVAFEPVDLNSVVQTALTESLSEPPSQIQTVAELAQRAPVVRGNRVQLEMALKLLIQNAFDAMHEGGVLRVQTREDARHAEVVVEDSGAGMDEIAKSRCFEPFFTTKAHKGGTGLGLSVVFGVVTRHSGSIEVESAPGQGTTFRIRLPKEDGLGDAKTSHSR